MNSPTDSEYLANLIDRTRTLVARLERLSADSLWAHRASGCRGSLLKALETLEALPPGASLPPKEMAALAWLVERGQSMLVRAARELIE